MDKEQAEKKFKWSELFQQPIIILSTVAGLCLIAKTWTIKKIFEQKVDVNDLIFPLIMLLFYETLHGLLKSKGKAGTIWENTWLWAIMIVISTVISTYWYVR
ncbi:hypothetical protein KKC97_01755 [bacterium]|nr:hypothetical protein [bacterium]